MAYLALFLLIFLQDSLLRTVIAAQFRDGDARLVGGSYQWEGRVEIFFAGSWGTITDSDWTSEDAQAVCRMLGYFRPGALPFTGAYFGQGGGLIHYDHIVCSGMEYNLTDCETGTGTRQSSHDEDVGVKCNTVDENLRSGDIRLVGGQHNWEGRVEVFLNGTWGTISSTNWGTTETKVVCRLLKLPSKSAVSANYGRGSGAIWMSSVTCTGSEDNITQCSHSMSVSFNHDNDTGVRCGRGVSYKNGDIRLVGGSYNWQGRVEIYLNGEWGTITDDGADIMDAHVVCRQLGYDTRSGYVDKTHHGAYFGEGVGTIHINRLGCSGTEYRLVDCSSVPSTWYHNEDWSVTCNNGTRIYIPEEGEVRLYFSMYNSNYYRGQLQVWLNSQWGVVSDNSWTSDDANTVCRQLGRNGIGTTSYYDYNVNFPVVMSNVQCVGTESRLIDCFYTRGGRASGWGSLVSLECSSTSPCTSGDVRLTGGQNENEGRLEICSSQSTWGTVCNKEWTEANSKVACRDLGFGFEKGSYQTYTTFDRTPATIPITADYVKCLGSESSMKECMYFSYSYSGCGHSHDIGVTCPPANCDDGHAKLLLGSHKRNGYVLICINNRWGPICYHNRDDTEVTINNTKTVCSQLGYAGGSLYFARQKSSTPAQNLTLHCYGNESRVLDCIHYPSRSKLCSYSFGVECDPASCVDGEVRLVDGDTDVEGRVEICFSQRWGTINGNRWTQRESTVVCNDLGFEPTGQDYSVRPATNSMPVYMKDVRCTGRELSILECGFRRNLTHTNHLGDVGVKCKKSKCVDGDLRLVGGDTDSEGVLLVCFNRRWGTVNGDGWREADTQVTCRQLGINNTVTGQRSTTAAFKPTSTPIHMDNVGCYGTEDRLIDCTYHTDSSEESHTGDIWIDCGSAATSKPDGSVNASNTETNDQMASVAPPDSDNDTGLAVALVSLVGLILLVIALVGYILYIRKSGLRQRMKVYYKKYAQGDAKVTITDENPVPKDYEDPKTTTPESHYVIPASSAPVNPSKVYQPLTVNTLEGKSCYAALAVKTNARSDSRGVNKGRNPPPPVPPLADMNTALYVNTMHH